MHNAGHRNSRYKNLIAHARRWGWPRAIFSLIVSNAARYLGIHIYVVRVRPIPQDPVYPETLAALAFRKLNDDDLDAASKDPALKMTAEFIRDAVARGDLAFGGFAGAQLISYIWRSAGTAPDDDGIWIRIHKPYNYAYKSFTRLEYRGKRISPVVHLFSDNEMRKLGFLYRAGFVAITNYASLNMGKHMGSKKIGYAGYIAWFGRLIPLRTNAVRKIGFEFFRPNESA